jgi:hypothetical protein
LANLISNKAPQAPAARQPGARLVLAH